MRVGPQAWLSRQSVNATHSRPFFHDAVCDDCVDSVVPPPVLSLECFSQWSRQRFYQLFLRWTLGPARCVHFRLLREPKALELAFDVVHGLLGGLFVSDLLLERPFQPLLLIASFTTRSLVFR